MGVLFLIRFLVSQFLSRATNEHDHFNDLKNLNFMARPRDFPHYNFLLNIHEIFKRKGLKNKNRSS